MPLVSVCIPASAQASDLELSLDSLVVQRYLDYEVVITDSSADESIERLVGTYDFGGRMRYFRNAHALDEALNRDEALRLSQGSLIKLLLPGDRFSDADALGRLVAMMEGTPDALLGCCASRDEAGHVRGAPDIEAQARIRRLPESLMIEDVIGPPGPTMYRRFAPLEFDPRLTDLAALDFHIRALRTVPRLAVAGEPLVVVPTRAGTADAHQRLKEIILVFGKAVDLLQHDPAFDRYFWNLLRSLGIRNMKQLIRVVPLPPSLMVYFQHLFAHPPREGRPGLFRRLANLLGGDG